MRGLKGTPGQGLVSATVGFFIGFAAVALFGPTAKKFQEAMGLSPDLVGLLVAVPALSGSLLRIPFAAWVDTTGGRKPFLTLLGLSVLGMLGLTLLVYTAYPSRLTSDLYPLLLLLGVLSGCGIATFSVGIGQVSYWFPQSRQGFALGTYAGLGNIAPGLFSFLIPFAMKSWGLAGAYLAWLLLLVGGTALYYGIGCNAWYFQLREQGVKDQEAKRIARERGQEIFPSGSLLDSLRISDRTWKTWSLVVVYFTTFGGFIALTAWLPTYWTSFYSVGAITAGMMTAVYSVLTSLIRVVGGMLSDQLGGEDTVIFALLGMLGGSFLMSFSHSFALSFIAEVFMALGMGIGNAAVFKLVPRYVPQAVGGAAGWVGGLGAFGGFVIPPVMGRIVGIYGVEGYPKGFVPLVALAALSLLISGFLRWTARRESLQEPGYAVAGGEASSKGGTSKTPVSHRDRGRWEA